MNDKRILLTGGGTAGHVTVNLALIPALQEDGWTIDYIGSKDGIEQKLIESEENIPYHPISTGKLRRYLSAENLKDPFKVLKGMLDAWRIIGKLKPSVVFSKGGFVSVPVIMAAKLRGIPIVIHESDFTPGLANKLSIPFAEKVLATFPETVETLPSKKTEHVGAIIRNELFNGDEVKGLSLCGFTKDKPVLLIMGGSAGAEKINQTVRENLNELLPLFQIVHICGTGKIDPSIDLKGYAQFEYVNEELKDILAAADFVLSRAGANAIFEFLALNIPMLLIPLSRSASRGDQIVNAYSFKDQHYARVLEEEQLAGESLIEELKQLQKQGPVIKDYMANHRSERSLNQVITIIQNTANKT